LGDLQPVAAAVADLGRAAPPASSPRNALTVDVEDYYHVTVFRRGIARSEWDDFESRVERNTENLLALFAERGVRATFFCLGCVAERHPALVARIAAAGHEIASHGYGHDAVHELTPEAFAEEARRSKRLLEDLSGHEVAGYRAPSFSITRKTLWALDALVDAGYTYDSSIFPIGRPDYGIADAPRDAWMATTPRNRTIAELPLTVATCLGQAIPVSGGGYFRLLPFAVTRWGMRKANREGRSGVFYLHPWEVDPEQPDLRGRTSRLGAFRHYVGLKTTAAKLRRLLDVIPFGTARDLLRARGLVT
jgi:polysaccharide deacetylase family protein (PEP-CTERM system associated)